MQVSCVQLSLAARRGNEIPTCPLSLSVPITQAVETRARLLVVLADRADSYLVSVRLRLPLSLPVSVSMGSLITRRALAS